MSSKVLVLLAIIAAGMLGVLLAVQQSEIERRADAIAATERSLATVSTEKRLAEEALRKEQVGCNRLFNWYERCLDGRTCTVAEGEQLLLHRHFDMPELPQRTLPEHKLRDKSPFREPSQ